MVKPNRLIHFISLMLAGIMLLCACNTASVAPNEPTPTVGAPSPVPTSKPTPTATLTPTPTPEPEPEKPELWPCDELRVTWMSDKSFSWDDVPDSDSQVDYEAIRMLPLIDVVLACRGAFDERFPEWFKPAKSWRDNQHVFKNDLYSAYLLQALLQSYIQVHPNSHLEGLKDSWFEITSLDEEYARDFMELLFYDFTDESPLPDINEYYAALDDGAYSNYIRSCVSYKNGKFTVREPPLLFSDYVVADSYDNAITEPDFLENGRRYCSFTLYRIGGDSMCYYNLYRVALRELPEPNALGLKYAICSVIRLDNADFEFEA